MVPRKIQHFQLAGELGYDQLRRQSSEIKNPFCPAWELWELCGSGSSVMPLQPLRTYAAHPAKWGLPAEKLKISGAIPNFQKRR